MSASRDKGSGKRLQHSQRRRLERKIDVSSSSSLADDMEEDEKRQRSISASSSGNENLKLRRRRRKRRTCSSAIESKKDKHSWQKQKLFSIEKALLNADLGEKSDAESNNEGGQALRLLAISEGGLISDEMRKKAWPRLLNIEVVETSVALTEDQIKANKNYHQVLMDVNRSLKRFPPGIYFQTNAKVVLVSKVSLKNFRYLR